MVSALNPTLSHAFREYTRFSGGFLRYATEFASRGLDFRLRLVGRLRNSGPSVVLALFRQLGRFVRGAATRCRYAKQKTKRCRNASHSMGFHGGMRGSVPKFVLRRPSASEEMNNQKHNRENQK